MSSSAVEPESPDLVCQLDNVQGVVDALTSVRWKRQQVPSSASFAEQNTSKIPIVSIIFCLLRH